MKREDDYYEKWLELLRTTQPVPDDPDKLTATILQRISQTTKPKPSAPAFCAFSKGRKVWSIGSWVSVAVAGWLLCLLVSETLFSPVPIPTKEEQRFVWKATSFPLPDHWKEMSTLEKSRHLSFICRQKELQRARKECVLESLVKNQTKSTGYENE